MMAGTGANLLAATGLFAAVTLGLSAPELLAQDRLSLRRDPAHSLAGLVVHIGRDGADVPVTDLALDLIAWNGRAGAALFSPNVPGRKPFDAVFSAPLLVVADGRLWRDGFGICSAWENDIAVCGVECDGGHFQLLREKTDSAAYRVTLRLAPMPDLIGGNATAKVRVGDCGEGVGATMTTKSGATVDVTFLPYHAY